MLFVKFRGDMTTLKKQTKIYIQRQLGNGIQDEFSYAELETKLKNLYELKADLNSSFDTFHALYSELTENVFDSTDGCDMFVQEDCIYRVIE